MAFDKNKGGVMLKTVCILEPTNKFCYSRVGEQYFIKKFQSETSHFHDN